MGSHSPDDGRPNWGLVCITSDATIRYRTITRTRFLALDEARQVAALEDLYRSNLNTLYAAVAFCRARGIRLYRATSGLFPQVDHPVGQRVLEGLRPAMAPFGEAARRAGVRVVLHPDQYVVLNSESPRVVRQSVAILVDHAEAFDRLGLPRSPWAAMNIHGGKGGRVEPLIEAIRGLPEAVRSRLTLENDESCFNAETILDVCRRAGVPMIFDAHHHVVAERLESYDHPSVARLTEAARQTWPDKGWQIVHISNGRESFADPRHHDMVATLPRAFLDVPWVEVEAKLKEQAVAALQARHGGEAAIRRVRRPPARRGRRPPAASRPARGKAGPSGR